MGGLFPLAISDLSFHLFMAKLLSPPVQKPVVEMLAHFLRGEY